MGDPAEDLPSAPRWARLELVTEGAAHFCADGSVLGSQGNLPETLTQHWTDLEPRHLLLGRENGFWFAFTPVTVARPFSLDGAPLLPGDRRWLDRVRHHLALDDLRIGLRLHPAEGGWFARVRGRRGQG
ncbi:MAG TPA: hypothetical protein VGD78_00830 [Chthoniobacterales bacterium]